MGIHQILYDRRVQEALDAYNAAHESDLVLRCGPDDLWAFMLTVEALGPQAECLQIYWHVCSMRRNAKRNQGS